MRTNAQEFNGFLTTVNMNTPMNNYNTEVVDVTSVEGL